MITADYIGEVQINEKQFIGSNLLLIICRWSPVNIAIQVSIFWKRCFINSKQMLEDVLEHCPLSLKKPFSFESKNFYFETVHFKTFWPLSLIYDRQFRPWTVWFWLDLIFLTTRSLFLVISKVDDLDGWKWKVYQFIPNQRRVYVV